MYWILSQVSRNIWHIGSMMQSSHQEDPCAWRMFLSFLIILMLIMIGGEQLAAPPARYPAYPACSVYYTSQEIPIQHAGSSIYWSSKRPNEPGSISTCMERIMIQFTWVGPGGPGPIQVNLFNLHTG